MPTRVVPSPAEHRATMEHLLTYPAVRDLFARLVPYAGPIEEARPSAEFIAEPQIVVRYRRLHWLTPRSFRTERVELNWPNVSAAFVLDETASLVLDAIDVEEPEDEDLAGPITICAA